MDSRDKGSFPVHVDRGPSPIHIWPHKNLLKSFKVVDKMDGPIYNRSNIF